MKEEIKSHKIPIIILTIYAFLFAQMTHYGFITNGSYGHDAGIFSYVGYAMKNGSALYTQIWENKGPLLYLINMVGVSINYYHGIYFIELTFFFISMLFAYKTALIITNKNQWLSVLATIFSMLLLTVMLEGGNMSEEYSLPFVCIALYFITKFHFNNNDLKKWEMIVTGMCFAGVFWLRINLCAFFVAMIIVTCIAMGKEKKWETLLRVTLFSTLGIIIFSLPILAYLILNNNLWACLQEAYLNTLGNFSPLAKVTVIQNVYSMIKATATTGYLYIAIVFIITYLICHFKKMLDKQPLKIMLSICFWGFIINLFANSLSGANHRHYFISFVPIMIIPASWLMYLTYQFFQKTIQKEIISNLVTFAIVLYISFVGLIQLGTEILNYSDYTKKTTSSLTTYVLKNTNTNDLVQTIGSNVTLNYQTKRKTGSRHVHFAAGRFNEEMISRFANEIAEDIQLTIPKLIIFGSITEYEKFKNATTIMNIEEFLKMHYSEKIQIDNSIIYKTA